MKTKTGVKSDSETVKIGTFDDDLSIFIVYTRNVSLVFLMG